MCVSMGMLDETGPGMYAANGLTRVLTRPEYKGGIVFCFDTTLTTFAALPDYLKAKQYQDPADPLNGPWQHANGQPGRHPFDDLSTKPEIFSAFHAYVHGIASLRPPWFSMYPVAEGLITGLYTDGDAAAMVDVGGGTGQVLQQFRRGVPDWPGRLVLQERADVIAAPKTIQEAGGLDKVVELQTHDFFTPQPVKVARAYFMRCVLHDWTDEMCLKILEHLKDAMTTGYSKILLCEQVVDDLGADWQALALDLYMMALASAKERTEKEWRELIEKAGMKVGGVWKQGRGNESLIEVLV